MWTQICPKADGYTKTYRDGVQGKGGEENEHFAEMLTFLFSSGKWIELVFFFSFLDVLFYLALNCIDLNEYHALVIKSAQAKVRNSVLFFWNCRKIITKQYKNPKLIKIQYGSQPHIKKIIHQILCSGMWINLRKDSECGYTTLWVSGTMQCLKRWLKGSEEPN